MSTIGGPGGIGGPKGPSGPEEPLEIDDVARESPIEGAQGVSDTADIDALAAEVAAGRLTPREALDQLVESTAGPGLDAADRAELRELLSDLVANDPYLGDLVGRL